MCLYLVWPPFVFLLAKNLRSPRPAPARAAGIALLGAAAVGTFALCWLPFLLQACHNTIQPLV